ncbi:exported protein of unknown function [Tenacibaculum sp. 190524A02b]|uniref:DUF6443 domain-containing protein n=1 Tax=Tenacibaculum vairaonense TaxID=3137860 RepID=UPI0032B27CB9
MKRKFINKIKAGLVAGCAMLTMALQAQTQTENYVVSKTYKKGRTSVVAGNNKEDVSTTIQYIDGLGRAKQSVNLQAGGGLISPKDIVTHFEYDNFGRQTKEYLPYASATNTEIRTGDVANTINTYYKTKYANDFAGVSIPNVNAYSEKVLENSPLNRVFEQTAPGKDWKKGSSYSAKGYTNNSHSIKFEYATNHNTEVRNYYVTTSFANNTYTPTLKVRASNSGFYKAGKLTKTVTKDENWLASDGNNHTTQEFKNKRGQVVLKRTYNASQAHETYYVYDDFGNLTYVIPPKVTTNDGVSPSELTELCYQYRYDQRNRLVEKKIPGKGWEYIVYDKLDRPILTQDANLYSRRKWLFTKYDILGREIYTGEFSDSRSRVDMQKHIKATNNLATEQYETRQSTESSLGLYYTNNNYPTAIKILTVNYYDDYEIGNQIWFNPATMEAPVWEGMRFTANVKSLPTVSRVRVLGTNANDWVTTASYYDDKGRVWGVYVKNTYLKSGDWKLDKLDFTGKVLLTKHIHEKQGKPNLTIFDRFEYDHRDRLISHTQKIENQLSERIVKNNYDELGQLESKLTGNGTRAGYKDVTSGISIDKDVITKASGSVWAVGLATSGSFNQDGYVEFSATQVNKYYMVGLSNVNTNAHYNTIKYAIYIRNSNTVHIYEKGKPKGQKTTYKLGDVFRVERIGNTIYYKKNNEIFYTSQTPSTGSLLGDISMYHTGGQIKDFKIVDNSKGLQKVDYAYNVRGWLKKINEDTYNDNDLFNFSLQYNDVTDVSKRLYNGNIAQANWRTANDNKSRSYKYGYDALNRITFANYDAVGETHNFSVFNILYDKNGNLTQLKRNYRDASGNSQLMDNLSYSYDNGNKLQKVTDRAHSSHKANGFKDGASIGNDYAYDSNGLLKADQNKGINLIQYNYLNKPTSIAKIPRREEVVYIYDANGVKLEKQVVSNNARKITQYAGNYIYDYFPKVGSIKLEYFSHSEGYVKNDGGTYNYVYHYKDHIGNVRLSYTDNDKNGSISPSTEIIEESNYYPFGLKHKGYNNKVSSLGSSKAQKYKYNGKELQDELGINMYDYGARFYDPATGRWFTPDAMAEKYYNQSLYTYTLNNPVYYIDPDGNQVAMCCDSLIGFVATMVDNTFGSNLRNTLDTGSASYGTGVQSAHAVSQVGGTFLQLKGTFDIGAGGTGMAATTSVTVGSGGTLSVGTAPGFAASASLTVAGVAEKVVGSAWVNNSKNNMQADGTKFNRGGGSSSSNNTTTTSNASSNKYTPNRAIKNDPKTGRPMVDPEAKGTTHTQLGNKKSSNKGVGTYSTRRTIDSKGNVRKQIDYTDHGRSKNHSNPHTHNYHKTENGQYKRQKQEKYN